MKNHTLCNKLGLFCKMEIIDGVTYIRADAVEEVLSTSPFVYGRLDGVWEEGDPMAHDTYQARIVLMERIRNSRE